MLGSVSILGKFDFVAKGWERENAITITYSRQSKNSQQQSARLNVYWNQQSWYFLSISEGVKWNKILVEFMVW